MKVNGLPDPVRGLVETYIARLDLPQDDLWITVDRAEFQRWLGRRVNNQIGGGFVYLPRTQKYAVLINLPRIDQNQPNALEIVVAEELLHMRDWIDGDRRGHAKHGYDRIAYRVAALTGATIEEVRNPLRPMQRRPYRYVYACPACGLRVKRRRKGTWSCSRCAPGFDPKYVLQIVESLT